jgi:hypothetical protein
MFNISFLFNSIIYRKEHVRQLVELIDFALQHLNSPNRIIQVINLGHLNNIFDLIYSKNVIQWANNISVFLDRRMKQKFGMILGNALATQLRR